MPDAPFTIRDGWHFPIRDSRRSSWLVSPERHPDDVPCLVVTGDLAAARELLAMGEALASGRVAMVLPTTNEQASAS